jgi:hypothetical protein
MSSFAIVSAVIFGVHSNDDSSGYPATGFLMMLWHIHMLVFTCTLLQTCAFWISARHTWQASTTGFRGIHEFNGPKFFQLLYFFVLLAQWHT